MGKTSRSLLFALSALALSGCVVLGRGTEDPYLVAGDRATGEELRITRETMSRAPDSPEAARGAFLLARDALHKRNVAEIDKNIAWLEKHHESSPWLPPTIYLRILAARDTEGSLPLLQRVQKSIETFPDDAAFEGAARILVPPALAACSRSDLETFLASFPSGALAPDVMLALGRLYLNDDSAEQASAILRRLVVDFPSSNASLGAFSLLAELSRTIPTNPRTIGALLPTTGLYSRYGKRVKQAIALAVEDARKEGHKFTFAVIDTRRDPERALQGFTKLVNERRVVAVFGPLFSATALLCAAEANTHGVVVLTPSALASGLTQTGPYVFRAAMTPGQEARTMAHFALENGFERFGILAPDSPYGRARARTFTLTVSELGGTVVAEALYPPDTADFSDSIVTIGGADKFGFKEREEEFQRKAQDQLETFLRQFFTKAENFLPPAQSSTVYSGLQTSATGRTACLILSSDPFSMELGKRLRAAALPYTSISVLAPKSATDYSEDLGSALARNTGELSGPEEIILGELLEEQFTETQAPFSVLISVSSASAFESDEGASLPSSFISMSGTDVVVTGATTFSQTASIRRKTADILDCCLVMYDSRLARKLAVHEFTITRPTPPQGNGLRLEAVYVPATGTEVAKIIPQLVYHNMDLPLLGSEAWNDDALKKRPESFVLESYFTACFWPTLDRAMLRQFVERYQNRYAEPPDFLDANAYDAARILMTAAVASDGSREDLRRSLLELEGFEGLSGSLRFTPAREVDRQPFILKVSDGSVSPVQW